MAFQQKKGDTWAAITLLFLFAVKLNSTLAYTPGNAPFLRRMDMTGVWKLTIGKSLLPKIKSSSEKSKVDGETSGGSSSSIPSDERNEILLRLKQDGSFDQYGSSSSRGSSNDSGRRISGDDDNDDEDELRLVLGRGGSWSYLDDDKTLILAPDRPSDADSKRIHDTVLMGKVEASVSPSLSSEQLLQEAQQQLDKKDEDKNKNLSKKLDDEEDDDDQVHKKKEISSSSSSSSQPPSMPPSISKKQQQPEDVHLSMPRGELLIGKFMYPKKHKSFFDQPMLFHQTTIGKFQLKQVLGSLNARIRKEQNDSDNEEEQSQPPLFHKHDFYNRTFYLTSEPKPVNQQYAKADKHYDESKIVHNLKVLPITFYPNNTFCAVGSQKLLRGRFGIAGKKGNKLWFQVSLFGAGRSAPGSVYSEGPGLSHSDRCGYLGTIQQYNASSSDDDDDDKDENKTHKKEATTTTTASSQKMTMGNNITKFFVQGDLFYGNDLNIYGRFRPSPSGTFTLQEISNNMNDDDGDVYDDDDALEDEEDSDQNDDDSDNSISQVQWGDDAFQ